MRPKITFDTLYKKEIILFKAFAGVATSSDYKKLFDIQAFQMHCRVLSVALKEFTKGNPSLIRNIETFANDPQNYHAMMQEIISNIDYFKNIVIPSRPCDFVVSENKIQDTYFWIEERVEITEDIKNMQFYAAKLMVDDKSDSLLFHNGEDGWCEYKDEEDKHTNFSGEVAMRYKEYLAEQQLLKD